MFVAEEYEKEEDQHSHNDGQNDQTNRDVRQAADTLRIYKHTGQQAVLATNIESMQSLIISQIYRGYVTM